MQIFSCGYKTVLSHFVDDGVLFKYASYTDFLTAAVNNDSAFALCSYTTVSCVILFMLVQGSFVTFCLCWFRGCYFSISFLTAAMNIDSAFALCI